MHCTSTGVRTTHRPTHRPIGRPLGAAIGTVALALLLVAGAAGAQVNQTLHTDGWILAAARAMGEHGSIWRTDLWIHFHSISGGTAQLYFCEQMQDGSGIRPYQVVAPSGTKVVFIEDAVQHFLGVGSTDWMGAIHYQADWNVQVWARVYSISADGSESYGQIIEGVPTADMSNAYTSPDYVSTDEDQWIYAIRHTSDGRYRVNVGAVNPTATATRVWVSVFDQGDSVPGDSTISFELPPYSMRQLSDPFASLNGGDWADYVIRVEAATNGAGIFGYASVVDNATNDAYFIRGVKLLEPTD
jgi:hypothetical protein